MKLLLTSGGIKNPSIERALVELVGKPIAESDALCIPTATYGIPGRGPRLAWEFVSGRDEHCPMTELGWRSLGVLELTTLPSLPEELWHPWVEAADVLLVNGGDPLYLVHWLRQTALADLLGDTVWVGLSAGSVAMTPRIGIDFVGWTPPGGADDAALGLVDFSIFPHLDHPLLPDNTMEAAERWASALPNPAYAIDDDTAIRVVDGRADVVSEGNWRLLDT